MAKAPQPRSFEVKEGRREAVNLKLGIFAPSGGGKTFSALRLAKGIQSVVGGDIGIADTENRRALHYAGKFKFRHIDFKPPFDSLSYVFAIEALRAAGCKTVIVDSMSHEHEGVGGLLEAHEAEVDRIAGDGASWQRRESVKMLAWQKPKANRRVLLNRGIINADVNLILLFRAKQSAKPIVKTVEEGGRQVRKTEVVQMGFVPVAGDEFLFEMDLCTLLLPAAGGVATWSSDEPGERMMIKVPDQFQALKAEYASKPLDEELGARLAQWAVGGAKKEESKAGTAVSGGGAPTSDSKGSTSVDGSDATAKTESTQRPREEAREDRLAERGFSGEGFPGEPLKSTGDPAGDAAPRSTPTSQEPTDSPIPGSAASASPSNELPLEDAPPWDDAPASQPPSAWAVYAETIAEARAWGAIQEALAVLTKSAEFKDPGADPIRKSRSRVIAYMRWQELVEMKVDTGVKDFLDNAQLYRCYIEAEDDVNALIGNGRAFRAGPAYTTLADAAKAAFDQAEKTRVAELSAIAAGAGEFA